MSAFLTDDPRDYCFFDTETRSLPGLEDPRWGDVTKSGVGRYSRSSKVIMFQYAIGPDDEAGVWEHPDDDFSGTMKWADAPRDLLDFHARALRGEAWYVAWNSAFDRNVCNRGMLYTTSAPAMPVRTVLDAMGQAVASNLPAGLGPAHKSLGGDGKLPDGKKLIKQFTPADGDTRASHPEDWDTFCEYGCIDVEAMREVFFNTRPLFAWEWAEFWASEVVNDRGLPIDRDYVERAATLARLYSAEVDERVKEITRYDPETEEGIRTVNQHVKMAQWVHERLEHDPQAVTFLTKRYEEDEEGELIPSKVSLERSRVEKLIPYLERLDNEKGLTDEEYDVLRLLEVREYGASATPKKFAKMLPMLTDDGRLPGQYVWNGAQQTGRYSSRGVQMHNLTRKAEKNEGELIEAILDIEAAP